MQTVYGVEEEVFLYLALFFGWKQESSYSSVSIGFFAILLNILFLDKACKKIMLQCLFSPGRL